MFIHRKFDSDRNRIRVQIVHSVRDGSKVRQKILRHVGIASSATQLEKLLELATVIMEEMKQAHSAQQTLFTPQQYADLIGLVQAQPNRQALRRRLERML